MFYIKKRKERTKASYFIVGDINKKTSCMHVLKFDSIYVNEMTTN